MRMRALFNVITTVIALALLSLAAPPLAAMGLVMGATTTTTDLSAAMKIMFEDSIVSNVVTDSELLDLFGEGGGIKTDTTTGGRYIETSQMFTLPAGVGARAEGGYIPVPNGPTVVNGRVTLKEVFGSVEMTGEVLKRVKGDKGAFLDWGQQSMPKLVERLTNELDRMALGYGAGIKARVNDASPATNLVVDSAFGVAGYSGALFQFLAGETLRVSANANGSSPRATVITVSAVDHDNGYLIVDDITNVADNDYIFEGDAADLSAAKEPMGLLGIVDDGTILTTFQNISRTTYPSWKALVVDAQADGGFTTGQKLTEEVVLYADDTAFSRGGAKIDTFVTSRYGLRELWADLKGDRVFNDPRAFTGGKGGIFLVLGDRTVPVRVARKMPDNVAFGLTRKSLKKWMLNGFEWDDTTGGIFKQVTDSTGRKNAFYAWGNLYLECGSPDPQKNFRIANFA